MWNIVGRNRIYLKSDKWHKFAKELCYLHSLFTTMMCAHRNKCTFVILLVVLSLFDCVYTYDRACWSDCGKIGFVNHPLSRRKLLLLINCNISNSLSKCLTFDKEKGISPLETCSRTNICYRLNTSFFGKLLIRILNFWWWNVYESCIEWIQY